MVTAAPVARVAVDVPLAHLDRTFDYAVPPELDATALPGTRVRVRFAGRLVGGWVLERAAASEHDRLAPLARLVSPEPALSPEVAGLCRAVADRWAGTFADVVRLAVPPRHARVEAEAPKPGVADPPVEPEPGSWDRYDGGEGFLRAVAKPGVAPRAVWQALPGPDWPGEVARAVQAALAAGRGAVVVVPDARDLGRADAALCDALGGEHHVVLHAELGPAERYRRFLAVRRGQVRAVVGTRSAAFAPVADLGLVVCWDDGDDLHKEPRAPYPHVRDVLVLRAHRAGAAALVGGFAPSVEAHRLVAAGWARPLAAPRAAVRRVAPRVTVAGGEEQRARLPHTAWQAARDALAAGAPVLVQVPRAGYRPVLACAGCRTPARCRSCAGPLAGTSAGPPPSTRLDAASGLAGQPAFRGSTGPPPGPRLDAAPGQAGEPAARGPAGPPPGLPPDRAGQPAAGAVSGPVASSGPAACRWCGRPATAWSCRECHDCRLRAVVVGSRRTAEELGRAFPGTSVRTSDRDGVVASVPAAPVLVVATPGAEPVADGGYGAVLLLDGWALLARPDLRAAEEALRRWCTAAALARPGPDGRVVVVADAGLPAVQALVRWDPATFARREAGERAALGFPPVVRMAAVAGPAEAVVDLLATAELPDGADVLGPVPHGDGERALVRVARDHGADLARALHAALGVRSARKAPAVRVELDPLTIA